MRGAAALLTALALAACSDEKGTSKPGVAPDAAATSTESAAATQDDAAAPPSAVGGGLRADISSLSGAVSGLATRITDQGLVVDLPADALFDYDKAELTPDAEVQLRKAAELIRQSPPGEIRVIGHTDSNGRDEYNRTLSEARAQTVAGWFGQQVGVRTRMFDVTGEGEARPVAPNARPDGSDDPGGRAKNRRVEVIIPTASQPPPASAGR